MRRSVEGGTPGAMDTVGLSPLWESLGIASRNAGHRSSVLGVFRAAFADAPDGMAVLALDGRVRLANRRLCALLGQAERTLLGKYVWSMLCGSRDPAFPAELQSFILNPRRTFQRDCHGTTADGKPVVWAVSAGIMRSLRGTSMGVIVHIRDVTERYTIQNELRKLSWAVEHSPASVMITDTQGRIEYVNPQFSAVTGYQPEDVLGKTPALLKSAETPVDVHRDMWKSLVEGQSWSGEFRNCRKDGSEFWDRTSVAPIRSESGEITHFVAVKEDITERKEAELRTWRQANFDAVTGLPNRVLFLDRLGQALTSERAHDGVAVIFVDLDHFKAVNDTLGHEAGDAVLRQVAQRLSGCVRIGDTVARLAGDEFTVLLPGQKDPHALEALARRIVDAMRQPFPLEGGKQAYIGASLGIAVSPTDGATPDDLLRSADHAMYRAKANGRNAFQRFTPEMNAEQAEHMQLETDLRRAVVADQFETQVRPLIQAADGVVVGAEIELVWRHPIRGVLEQSAFWAMAEDIGVAGDLSALMVQQGCVAARSWHREGLGRVRLHVPVSVRSLAAPQIEKVLTQAVERAGLSPADLQVMIPEAILGRGALSPGAERSIRALADLGYRIGIHGFGTGYAALRQVRSLPISAVQLAEDVVAGLGEQGDEAVVSQALIAMVRKLGVEVMADLPPEADVPSLLAQGLADVSAVRLAPLLGVEDFLDMVRAQI